MQIAEQQIAKMERVLKPKHIKKPGQYMMVMTVQPKDENRKTVVNGQSKITAFIGGMCPRCSKEIFGDIDIDAENSYLVCPNEDCALEFKIGANKASIEAKI